MPAPIHNFAGLGNHNNVQPPDTEGDIGYDPASGVKYYMQWVNLSLAIWDVTDPENVTLLLGPANGNTLFSGFGGPCENTNSGDPIVLFDHLAHRWLASQFALPGGTAGPYYQCVAVSKEADPTGEWHRYEYQWPVDKFNDYPKFAVWPDAYYLTVNQFTQIGPGTLQWGGAGVAALERSEMLAGRPARLVFFDLYEIDANFGGMLPADLDGPLPPDGSPGYFLEWDDSIWLGDLNDTIRLWEFKVDWTNTASSTFGLEGLPNALLATTDVDPDMCGFQRNCIPQPGTTNKLDAIADRLMYRVQYRNFGGHQSLVSNHTVDADGSDRGAIHWLELRKSGGSWSLHQDGVFSPDEEHRWMASTAMDHVGNLALGYSVSSAATFPSIRYTGRLASDPLGSMPQGEVTLVTGGGSQTSFSNRWGDYSMMGVDPTDDCTFWYTQEYYQTSGSGWQTRIGSFKFPDCFIGPTGTLEGLVADQQTGNPLSGAQLLALGTVSQTGATSTDDQGRYSVTLPIGTYDVTVLVYGYVSEQTAGVTITENTTTMQDFMLVAANLHVVEGVVKDGSSDWPLYARLTIRGDPFDPPFPTDDTWTDPATGYYSVTLAEGITYTFNVAPMGVGLPT